jgi:hypothetical protein
MNNAMPAPVPAVPNATSRVRVAVADLENMLASLEDKLSPVVEPSDPKAGNNTAAAPMHAVPLAAELHDIGERVEAMLARARSLLDRVHV